MHNAKMFLLIIYPAPFTKLTAIHTSSSSSCCISVSPKDKPQPGNLLHSTTPANTYKLLPARSFRTDVCQPFLKQL